MRRPVDPFAPAGRPARAVPFEFVLEQLAELEPTTRPMFGCTAVYVAERILFVLRRKGSLDDGVWVACEPEQLAALQRELPALKPIEVLGSARGWRNLRADSASFEADVLRACALARAGDLRIGKVPQSRKRRATAKGPGPRARGTRG